MTNVQAAIGLAQIERIDELIRRKRWIADQYNRRLQGIPGLQLPTEKPWAKQVYWMYGVVLEGGLDLDAVKMGNLLREKGVDTRPFFLGMHEQPVFHKMGLFTGQSDYPIAEMLARRGLYLPSGLALNLDQIETVCEAVREILT